LLQPGERTQVFQSESRILESYGVHRIGFFYLHVGTEVVRIEIPHWVASDPELLNQIHAVAYTQADKGDGYPIALAEAHQQAVVRGSERNMFYEMVTTVLVRRGMRASMSPKNMRKRRMTV
ncbi:MAG: DNA double-strand break repair nuclease NurA, partial [Candidatus Tectomicrobia bacterium]|nr:DNA double-strand break repair nuclease NurA [Candidatus Tectomicrobia bacterium]